MELLSIQVNAQGRSTAFGKAVSISVLNQIVSSGSNFVLGLYLVRALTPAEFGLYGIGFAISLLYGGVGNALFLTQMVVHAPDKALEERLPYAGRMFLSVATFCGATVLLAALAMLSCQLFLPTSAEYLPYGVAVVAASVGYLLKEFFVRHAYNIRKENRALAANLAMALVLIVLLVAQHLVNHRFSVETALGIYALAQGVAALVGYRIARLPLSNFRKRAYIEDLRLSWSGGRWALGGVAVTWLQSQAYVYVSAAFLGTSGVGHANAARLLIAPFLFLVPAFNQIAAPRLASLRTSDSKAMKQLGMLYTLGMTILAITYLIALALSFDVLAPLLLGQKYSDIGVLVAAWCVVLLAQLTRDSAATILQAVKEFKVLMTANALSATVAISAAAILAWYLGVAGCILGTGIGEVILAYLLWKKVLRNG